MDCDSRDVRFSDVQFASIIPVIITGHGSGDWFLVQDGPHAIYQRKSWTISRSQRGALFDSPSECEGLNPIQNMRAVVKRVGRGFGMDSIKPLTETVLQV
jgi:hypothetical protein